MAEWDAESIHAELTSIRAQIKTAIKRCAVLRKAIHQIRPKGRPGRPPGVLNGGRSLESFIVDVLKNSNEPLTAKQIAELVLDNGYKTISGTRFIAIVFHTLTASSLISRVTRGRGKRSKPSRYVVKETEKICP